MNINPVKVRKNLKYLALSAGIVSGLLLGLVGGGVPAVYGQSIVVRQG
jgi:hypothetical protein